MSKDIYQTPASNVLVESEVNFNISIYTKLFLHFPILIFCSLQLFALTYWAVENWNILFEMLAVETQSLSGLLISYFFACVLMLAGTFLMLSRKIAIGLFTAYLPYQIYNLVTASNNAIFLQATASIIFEVALLLYCVYLFRRGKLK